MLRLFQRIEHPLRIYIEGDQSDSDRLIYTLNSKFFIETDYNQSEEVKSIFFNEGSSIYYFPAGILSIVVSEMRSLRIEYFVEKLLTDNISEEEILDIDKNLLEGITLRDYQIDSIRISLLKKRGLIQIATGGGKSEVMIAICSYIVSNNEEGSILVCVPTTNLLHQTYERMVERGIPAESISRYGDGYQFDENHRIVISTVQTAYRRLSDKKFCSWYKELKCVILDEAQHGACNTWYTLIDTLSPEYIIGLSAEPFYGDIYHQVRDLVLRGTIGPVLYRVSMEYLIAKGYLAKPYVISMRTSYPGNIYNVIDWHVVNKLGIITNKQRNSVITSAANSLISKSMNPLILVQQINHGKELAESISVGKKVALVTGSLRVTIFVEGKEVDSYKDSESQWKVDFENGVLDAVIATSVLEEGVDLPVLSSVILAGGSKSKLKLIQKIGRSLRRKPGANITLIIDFQDKFNVVLHSHHKKRKSLFEENNIPVYYCDDTSELPKFIDKLVEQRIAEISVENC